MSESKKRIRYRKWLITLFCENQDSQDPNLVITYDKEKLELLLDPFIKDDKCVVLYILHDKDEDTNPHYHVILQSESQIDFNKLKSICTYWHLEPQRSSNIVAYNYLIHNTKDSKDKYQYSKEDIYCNLEPDILLLWLGNQYNADDRKEVGIDILNCIENSLTLWQVIKSFPELWRDIGKIKELWYIHKLHDFHIDREFINTIKLDQDNIVTEEEANRKAELLKGILGDINVIY